MKALCDLITAHDDWLNDKVISFAQQNGYIKYTSKLKSAWSLSISGLSSCIVEALKSEGSTWALDPETDYARDPLASFGIAAARRHRSRGISLGMFLGLLKYYRQSYLDLVKAGCFPKEQEEYYQLVLNRVMDRMEIGICTDWTTFYPNEALRELQTYNREINSEKNKYMTIYECLPNSVLLFNSQYEIECYNAAALTVLLGEVPEGGSFAYKDLLTHQLAWLVAELQSLTNLDEYIMETELESKDGLRNFEIRFGRMQDVNKNFSGFVVIFNDITARKLMQTEIEQQREWFKTTLQSIGDAVIATDTQGHVLFLNPVAEELTGYSESEAYGRPIGAIFNIINEDTRLPGEIPIHKVISDGVIVGLTNHTALISKEGLERPIADSAAPIINSQGTIIGTVLVFRDISQSKEAERRVKASEAMYRELFNHISSGAAVYASDDAGTGFYFKDLNRAAEKIDNISREDLVGKNVVEVFPGIAEMGLLEVLQRVWQTGTAEYFPLSFYHDARISGWRENYVYKLPTGEVVAVYDDVTAKKLAEQALQKSEKKFRTLFNNAGDVIYLSEFCGDYAQIIEVNDEACSRLGYTRDELLSMATKDINAPEMRGKLPAIIKKILAEGHLTFETEFITKEQRRIPVEVSAHAFFLNEKKVFLSIARDITERKKTEEKLKFFSLHDTLTSLYNRSYFEQEIQKLAKEPALKAGIIVCDVDGLKLINDTLGHDTGDALLKTAAHVISNCFREKDTVSRIGGDEFAIILRDCSREDVEYASLRLRNAIEEYNGENPGLPLSISIGLAARNGIVDLHELYKEADNNMYSEKLHRSQSARSTIIHILKKLLEARDFITEGHAERLQQLVASLAAELGLSKRSIADLRLLAQFHDIGKVGIPDRILFKPGPLTSEEYTEMQRHSEIGHRIALSAPELASIADWIVKHHERWDGNGYPLGLKSDEIPLECRILTIADSYDAMTSDRPYRKAMSHDEALAELKRCAGTQFDPDMVTKFIKVFA